MADLASVASAAQDWFRANIQGAPSGQFFQSRVTRTPGIVQDLGPKFHADYQAEADPSAVVRSSMLDAALKEVLAREWSGQKGLIRVQPYAVQDSPTLRHEQVHDIFAKGGLGAQTDALLPLINPATLARLAGSKTYSQEAQEIGHDRMQLEEGSAFDLSSKDPNLALRDEVMRILAKTGKTQQATQLRRLTK